MVGVEATQGLEFAIEVNPNGDGGAYRITNMNGEINRSTITERGDSLFIQAELKTAVHGKLNSTSGVPASLVITDFWFLPGKKSRRFTWAKITYDFSGPKPKDATSGPIVKSIAPIGHFSLHPTLKHVEAGRAAKISAQVAAGPANPGLEFSWDLKESYDTEDQIVLTGKTITVGRDFGGRNAAVWTLMENETIGSGIPTRLRTAILLERRPNETKARFQATVEIEVKADLVGNAGIFMQRLFGRIPKDDPVIFDPQESTTGEAFALGNLVGEKLEGLSRVETTTKKGSSNESSGTDREGAAGDAPGAGGGVQPGTPAGTTAGASCVESAQEEAAH